MSPLATPRSLGDLVAETEADLGGAQLVHGDPAAPVTGVTQDTRRLQPGDLFVAIAGLERDGADFVLEAISGGASAIAVSGADRGYSRIRELTLRTPAAIPLIALHNARAGLADLAAAFYGHPSQHFPVVGITGTDGKTSTTHLLSRILEVHGLRTGWLTTVNTKIADDVRPNTADHTTPEAPLVQRTLAEMRDAHLDVALLETSSHALELQRVRAVHFRVGIFTNLSPEHLNFHGSFEAYRAAKRKLFERLPADGLAALNADDPSSDAMRAVLRARCLTYGLDHPADFTATDVRLSPRGTTFTLQPAGIEVRSRLVGRFNVSNWLAAYAAATYFGATPLDLVEATAAQPAVLGRMNLVEQGQPFAVVVDFAHTPQALDKALDTVRSLVSGHILLAFGLAGGRDDGNRPVMGELAARKADYFVITMDDPGYEDPAAIADQIAVGAFAAGARAGDQFTIELDRRAAIRALCARAQPGDAVLLAGKGHEQRMVIGGERRAWNDARAATAVLIELGFEIQAVP
ncbi:MAG: UDP-N-acetylmuramoyl-L-alanyl-D-glutamate--2,6-diaminopimelate ligase [Chloroflexi bacterium]|nr:UDP-N-acetylmuramoyl-L-alanyl-D-glutamate--2,6-diaminopimelate ligase [Chloroflexota bacterium]